MSLHKRPLFFRFKLSFFLILRFNDDVIVDLCAQMNSPFFHPASLSNLIAARFLLWRALGQ